MKPVIMLCRNVMEGNKEAYNKMLTNLNIQLKGDEKDL